MKDKNNNNKIRKGTITSKKPSKEEEEPGFKEYSIIFTSVFLLIFGAYIGFEIFYEETEDNSPNNVYKQANITDEGFSYPSTTFDGRKANVQFAYDLQSLESFQFRQDLNNKWFDEQNNISIITPTVLQPRLENALLIKASGKLASYIRNIQGIRLGKNNFQTINQTNSCEFASKDNALIIFKYNSSNLEVVIDEQTPNCVEINVNQSGVDFIKAVDMILFDAIIKNTN